MLNGGVVVEYKVKSLQTANIANCRRSTMAAGGEFVEGWLVAQVLGEGSYGEWVFRSLFISRRFQCKLRMCAIIIGYNVISGVHTVVETYNREKEALQFGQGILWQGHPAKCEFIHVFYYCILINHTNNNNNYKLHFWFLIISKDKKFTIFLDI